MTDPSYAAERFILYLLILLAAVCWLGVGGMIFLGILQNAAT